MFIDLEIISLSLTVLSNLVSPYFSLFCSRNILKDNYILSKSVKDTKVSWNDMILNFLSLKYL